MFRLISMDVFLCVDCMKILSISMRLQVVYYKTIILCRNYSVTYIQHE